MSTTVPYWSNMQTLTDFLMASWLTNPSPSPLLRGAPAI
jgi:hypothetical protein